MPGDRHKEVGEAQKEVNSCYLYSQRNIRVSLFPVEDTGHRIYMVATQASDATEWASVLGARAYSVG